MNLLEVQQNQIFHHFSNWRGLHQVNNIIFSPKLLGPSGPRTTGAFSTWSFDGDWYEFLYQFAWEGVNFGKFRRAIFLFSWSNEFSASIRSKTLVGWSLKQERSVLMAYSMPPFCPRQSCVFPPSIWRSGIRQVIMHQPIVLLKTSPIPMGRIPESLYGRIRRHALKTTRFLGGRVSVASLYAIFATFLQSSFDYA